MAKHKRIVGLKEQERKVKSLIKNLATSITRSAYGGLGQSYFPSSGGNAKRDLYEILGYKKELMFQDFYNKYKRQDLAKTLINAPVEYSWREKPIIIDQADSEGDKASSFQTQWEELVDDKNIYSHLMRADRLSGIGCFGLLLIGVNDKKELSEPIGKADKILYIKEYMEESITIKEYEEDIHEERYGMPLMYTIKVVNNAGAEAQAKNMDVHWSRVIHIAENLVDNEIIGTPRLESVFNRLQDIEQLAGGSSEMFWRGAFPGYAFSAKEDAEFDEDTLDDLEDEIQDYMHELKRYIRLQGIDVQSLATQIASPKDHFDILVTLISAGKQMPKRILTGSERGELASTQDERAWLTRMESRRLEFNEPVILRSFISILLESQVLPQPEGGKYTIQWPDLITVDPKESAEVQKIRMETLKNYVSTPGASLIIPEDIFLRRYMDMDLEDIKEINNQIKEMQDGVMRFEDIDNDDDDEDIIDDMDNE